MYSHEPSSIFASKLVFSASMSIQPGATSSSRAEVTAYRPNVFVSPEHEPSQRFPVKFYMVAMLYIVFDIEIIFLLLWATQFYYLGWYGIIVMGIFTLFVLETLYYVWKRGVLDWNTPGRLRYYGEVKDAA